MVEPLWARPCCCNPRGRLTPKQPTMARPRTLPHALEGDHLQDGPVRLDPRDGSHPARDARDRPAGTLRAALLVSGCRVGGARVHSWVDQQCDETALTVLGRRVPCS